MAFCGKCGTSLNNGTGFCGNCGAPVGSTSSANAKPSSSPGNSSAGKALGGNAGAATVAANASNSTKKIIIGLLVVFAALAVFALAGSVYVGYRVHKKVEDVRRQYPTGQFGAESAANASVAAHRGACSLITQQEMGDVLGIPIVKIVHRTGQCEYIPQGASRGLTIEPEWAGAREAMKLQTGLLQKMENQTFGSVASSQAIPGLGDEAYAQMGMLTVRKNDVSVTLDTNSVITRDQEIAIARKIVPRM